MISYTSRDMGCSTCTKGDSGGCDVHKVPQRATIDEVMARVYPSRAWGDPDDEARFGAGVRLAEVMRLSRALSVATKAPTFVREGGDDDLCNFIYVLCVGRAPSLLELRDSFSPEHGHDQIGQGEEKVRERYLRVAVSTVARLATVQEISMELDRLPTGELEIRELPRPGVYDGILLKRMRKVVSLLQASDLMHLDFGLVDKPVPDADGARYTERYAETPRLVNYLFYSAPPTTASVVLL
jgi:hypothetical protein